MNHTKEPWTYVYTEGKGIFKYYVHGFREDGVKQYIVESDWSNPEDNKRLVACVNALANIKDPEGFVKRAKQAGVTQ